jgi:hypothetical protein
MKCENEKVSNVAHNLPLYTGSLEMVYRLRWRWCVVLLHSKTSHLPSLKTASLSAARKNSLDPCTAPYQNIIITDISSLMLQISGGKPPKHQISTPLQHSTTHKHPTGITTCSEVSTPVTSRCCHLSSTLRHLLFTGQTVLSVKAF